MFERKLSRTGAAPPPDFSDVGHDGLRPVKWPDLVARLDAARELRAELGAGEAPGDASFDPDSARHIAELAGGIQAINFDDLSNGKTAGHKALLKTDGAVGDDARK